MYQTSPPGVARFGLLAPLILTLDAWLLIAVGVSALL
jgi:hypothetical protein